MASSDRPRATIIAWALFLIFILVGAGSLVTLGGGDQSWAGAIMLSTACLCLTLLARPTR
ncbi:MAG: hypothetical protein QF405_02360 [Roseibacillus sp.]|nr:hypothetical protein [Roseibacillus sp.]MDP7105675.1 hypothetical protein [Roseibacillus sp.]MDP7306456.1 hypothetical protein [Roseibacillus sp.]MDP7497428.1 hypothetical protein [Roseibacillus sp.]MDP7656909.1 hypothetical protein [Roseibacillus sp.]